MKDAFFAGRVFVPGEQNGFRFFLWGEGPKHFGRGEQISFSSSFAEPADGAFLCQLQAGWIFVTGAGKNNHFRHTFTDETPQAAENARAMHEELGIPIVSIEEGNLRIRADGVAIYSITDDEKRRDAAALARSKTP